jgi:hypothetical protein
LLRRVEHRGDRPQEGFTGCALTAAQRCNGTNGVLFLQILQNPIDFLDLFGKIAPTIPLAALQKMALVSSEGGGDCFGYPNIHWEYFITAAIASSEGTCGWVA